MIEKDKLSDTSSEQAEMNSEMHAEIESHAVAGAPEATTASMTEAATEAATQIEWHAAELDFVEAASPVSRLAELAQRVAETVAQNEALLSDSHQPQGELQGEPQGELQAELVESEFAGAISDEVDQAQGHEHVQEREIEEPVSDATSEPVEFIEHDRLISIIDSMLFATDKPVSVATMKSMFKDTNVRTRDIQRALDILASECAAPTRGMTLEEINGGYQYRTKVDNAAFLKRLGKARAFRLSGQALEVMSIIAYKQPVTKHEVDEIRGVESGHLVRALMERGLVSFQGKAENLPGKPMSYGTTRKFLEIFGLRNIKELPTLSEIDELIPEGIGEVEERETLSELTDKLSNQVTASYSEGEDELLKIHDSLQTIETSTEFFEQEKQRERNRRDEERARDIRERLLVEEAVEDKDRKWLARYEAKLNEAAALAAAGAMAAEAQAHEPGAHGALESEQATADDSVIADSELAGQLEALTQGKVDDDSLADDSFDDVDDLDIALNDDDLDDDSDVDTSDDV